MLQNFLGFDECVADVFPASAWANAEATDYYLFISKISHLSVGNGAHLLLALPCLQSITVLFCYGATYS